MNRYNELAQEARDIVDYLEGTRSVSDQVRYGGIFALNVYLNTCTPEESVPDFEFELECVKGLIALDLEWQG